MSKVLDGAYKGWLIVPRARYWIFGENRLVIAKFPFSLPLTSQTIKGWEALSSSSDKDAMSMAGRALAGSFLLGPLGLIGGAATAKSKGTAVAIEFKNGKRSLVQLDPEMYAKFQFDLSRLNYEGSQAQPGFDAPQPKKRGCLRILLYAIIGFILLSILMAIVSPQKNDGTNTRSTNQSER